MVKALSFLCTITFDSQQTLLKNDWPQYFLIVVLQQFLQGNLNH